MSKPFRHVALLGCGLMGGSLALALKQAGLAPHIVGYSRSVASSEQAHQMGAIDTVATTVQDAAQGADLVIVAVPVAATQATLEALYPTLQADALVMDLGSTKQDVVAAAAQGLRDRVACFVPAHPVAGKEVAGIQHATAQLYRGHQVVLTPTPETSPEKLTRATALWQALDCNVVQMTPQAHDTALAAVSHLPHVIAYAFMNGLAAQADVQTYLDLAGPGFRDFSRIAASNPSIWHDIVLANKVELLAQIAHFKQSLAAFEAVLTQDDSAAVTAQITQASQLRAQWPRAC